MFAKAYRFFHPSSPMAKYISNTAFIVSSSEFSKMITYLRTRLIPAVSDDGAGQPCLLRVAEICGAGTADPDIQNVSLQMHFDSLSELHEWRESTLTPALAELYRHFSNEEICFSTVLENIPL